MNCYRHRDPPVAAVGVCVACGRALCPECCAETPAGLACRGGCEDAAARRAEAAEAVLRSTREGRTNTAVGGLFMALMGAVIVRWGWVQQGAFDYIALIGSAFLLSGLVSLARGVVGLIARRRSAAGMGRN